MSCDKPTGDCTKLSGCGCSDSGGTPAEPVLPRCNNALADGTYTNATVVVENGCIVSVQEGDPFVYTPDECCPGGGSSGGGSSGGGTKGDPGRAATIAVADEVLIGEPKVENLGTESAAIFQFTLPASSGGGGSPAPTGFTGTVDGLKVENGIVKAVPGSFVTDINTDGNSVTPAGFGTLMFPPDTSTPSERNPVLDLTGLKQYVDDADTALSDAVDSLTGEVEDLTQRVNTVEAALVAGSVSQWFMVDPMTGRAFNPGPTPVTVSIFLNGAEVPGSPVTVPAEGTTGLPGAERLTGTDQIALVKAGTTGVGVYVFNHLDPVGGS